MPLIFSESLGRVSGPSKVKKHVWYGTLHSEPTVISHGKNYQITQIA
jgi:hypothetical protein